MSEFSSDLNSEKLDELRSSVDSLKDLVSQIEGDFGDMQFAIDRLETLEFFDRGDGARQTIVHWLKDVEPEKIETIEDAKEAFVDFSEARAEDDKEHQVGHGDILVIGGECPYYAVCAKVDRGVGGGDAGFQEEDTLDVAGTEEENEKAYKEFIVWGGCGNEGVIGDPCAGQGGATASAVGGVSVSSTSVSPTKIGIIGAKASEASEISTIISKLKDLSLNATGLNSGSQEFIGLKFNSVCSSSSEPDCKGMFMDVMSVGTSPVKVTVSAEVGNETAVFKPVDVVDKELTISSTTTTISATGTAIGSTACGDVSNQDGGGGSSSSSTLLTGLVSDTSVADKEPTTLHQASITPLEDNSEFESSAIVGGSLNVSKYISDDFTEDDKVFLPVVSACPQTGAVPVFSEFWATGTSAEITRACGEDSTKDTQQVTVTLTPKINTLNFECGLLVSTEEAETMGNAPTIQFTMEIPCGTEQTFGCEELEICDNDGSDGNPPTTRTITVPKYVDANGDDVTSCPSESGGS